MKQEKNDRIRKDYHEPPKLSQWEEILRQQIAQQEKLRSELQKPPKFPGLRQSISDYSDNKVILQTIDPKLHPSKSVMGREEERYSKIQKSPPTISGN